MGRKILFIGGVKSGKSLLAEQKILEMADSKTPVYLATSECFDAELAKRIQKHQAQRGQGFTTLEEPLNLVDSIPDTPIPVLLECLSMWLNNMLHHDKNETQIECEIERLIFIPNDLVMVINDVSSGVLPENRLARKYVDLNGRMAQRIASECDEVYHCIAGIATRIK